MTQQQKGSRRDAAAQQRLATIRAIQVMRRRLDLDEDTYRDLVERISREQGSAVRSVGDCSQAQLNAVATELRRKLGQPAHAGWKGKPQKLPLSRQARMDKIEALLAHKGRAWEYAHAMARRICKVDRLEFCDGPQLSKIIAALEYDRRRHPGPSRAGDPPEPARQ